MSLKTDAQSLVAKIEAKAGKLLPFLIAHVAVVIQLEQDLLNVLQSTPPAILSAILPPELVAILPNLATLLEKAIADELIGTAIITDVNNAIGLEAKLQILIADIQKTPGMNKGIIRDICAAVLADLNNNVLTAAEYAIYMDIKKMLGDA